jgi:undecaprenyl diphosphate synthase
MWQAAYSELVFSPLCWPDFDDHALDEALLDYGRRQRRFGGLDAVGAQPL